MQWILIAVGGGLGALSRAGLTELSRALDLEKRFPYGTLAANLGGCFLIGFVMTLLLARMESEAANRMTAFFVVGYLGSLTTFSAFAWQSGEMLNMKAYWPLALNVAANLIGGLLLVGAGIAAARAISQP